MIIKLNALSERKYSIYKFTNHFYDFRISISCEGIILSMSQNLMVSIKGNDIGVQLFWIHLHCFIKLIVKVP